MEEGQVTEKDRPIKITSNFSTVTLKSRRALQSLKKSQVPAQTNMPSKTLTINRKWKMFHGKSQI